MSRKLTNWLNSYIEYNVDSESPEIWLKWAAISTIAAALQRKCWITRGRLVTYPNLYTLLVGPAAVGKGMAMDTGSSLIKNLNIPMVADSASRRGFLNGLKDSEAQFEHEEKVITHTSVSLFSTEASVFFKEGAGDLLDDLTDIFDNKPSFTDRTDKHGKVALRNVWVNILGGITPTRLKQLAEKDIINSGLASRILFIFADQPRKCVAMPEKTPYQDRLFEDMLSDLTEMHFLQGEFQKTQEYIDKYVEWYEYFFVPEHYPIQDKRFDAYCKRRLGLHVPKLALIMSAARGGDKVVDVCDFEAALDVLTEAEKLMPLALGGIGQLGKFGAIQFKIMETIRSVEKILYSDLLYNYRDDILEEALWMIVLTAKKIGICTVKPLKPRDNSLLPPEFRSIGDPSALMKALYTHYTKENYRYRNDAVDWIIARTNNNREDQDE